ncbi:MAG TPA: S8 family peptidase [Bacteroidia bacterium]|nr:S8 family peptidase [Bacteroidia bacterium]
MVRFLFFSLLISATCLAQQSKMNVALIKALHTSTSKNYPVLVKGNVGVVKDFVAAHNGLFKYNAGNISSVILSGQAIQQLAKSPQVKQIEYYINHVRPLDDTAIVKNNVLKIHNGVSPLPQAYDGKGVIYGLIDTGIDFTHPDFKDSTGKSRVIWLWDQTKPQASNTPQPYNYGQEWNNQEIDSGLCTHQDLYAFGHGTRVAGISAGNGNFNPMYKGIAPKAEIMCAAIDFSNNGPTVLDGLHYLVEKAVAANKPFVINISLGDYYGSHDGLDLQSLAMDSLMANIPGRCLVAAAGNAGNDPFHLQYHVNADTNFTFMRNSSANEFAYGIFADTTNFKNVKYTIGVYDSTNFQYLGNIGFRNITSALNTVTSDTIKVNGAYIGVIETAAAINGKTYELDIDINADSLGFFWTLETTGSGFFDAWDFEYVPANQVPAPLASMPKMAYYKEPDINQTLCTSFQCSNEVITVANYNGRRGFVTLGGVYSQWPGPYDTLSFSSSAGPTRDGRLKPDIAATGDNIVAPGTLSLCQWDAINDPGNSNISQDTMYMIFNGTSAASPNVAGVAVLYLQKNPTATNQDIKQAIINCPKHDYFTGTNLPNNNWGYGKLDGFGALTCNMQTTGIKSDFKGEDVLVYPNPAQQQIQFTFNNNGGSADVIVYSLLGEQVYSTHAYTNNVNVPVQQLADGLYLYKILKNNTLVSQGKFVKN